ncbi:MAG: PaaI family thioesterase [Oscillospiraceae bacterium]|nr:PaaI family thioesterase [Oscillospiraceae bacterium]
METKDLAPQRSRAAAMMKEHFGLVFTRLEPGEAWAEWPLREQDFNVHGIPYGGVLFTLADSTAGMALGTLSSSVITISSSGSFIYGSADAKTLHAHAKVSRAGNSIGFIRSEVYDDRDRLLATFEFTFGRKP